MRRITLCSLFGLVVLGTLLGGCASIGAGAVAAPLYEGPPYGS